MEKTKWINAEDAKATMLPARFGFSVPRLSIAISPNSAWQTISQDHAAPGCNHGPDRIGILKVVILDGTVTKPWPASRQSARPAASGSPQQ